MEQTEAKPQTVWSQLFWFVGISFGLSIAADLVMNRLLLHHWGLDTPRLLMGSAIVIEIHSLWVRKERALRRLKMIGLAMFIVAYTYSVLTDLRLIRVLHDPQPNGVASVVWL
jgi:hypothetical protein